MRHRVQLPGAPRRFLGRGRAERAQVVGRLQPPQPRELVGLVELLARSARHVDVERLRLVDPFLPARRAFDQPARLDLERGRVEAAHVGRDAVDLGERPVEVLEVGDHDLVPQVELLQIAHQELVDDREFARQVRFHVQVLVRGLDALRKAGDVGDRRRRRDGEAVRVAHADLLHAAAQRFPVERRRHVALDVAAALFLEQLDRVERQDAAVPERALERRIRAALFGEVGRSPERGVGDRFHRAVGELDRGRRAVRHAQQVQAVLEAHDAQAHRAVLEVRVPRLVDRVEVEIDHVVEHAHRRADRALQLLHVHAARSTDRGAPAC